LNNKTPRTDAEAKFARTQKRATDAARAVSDAAAEAKRVEDNTARLRALRLARDAKEAADREAGILPPAAKAKAKPKAGATAKVATPHAAKVANAAKVPTKVATPNAAKAAKPNTAKVATPNAAKPNAGKVATPNAAKVATPGLPPKGKAIPVKKLNARNDG
jgi:hypothetical protein